MIIDRRFLIEERWTMVRGEVRDLLDALARRAARLRLCRCASCSRCALHGRPRRAGGPAPPPARCAGCSGRQPQFICSPGTYDQKHVDRIGKLKDCIAYGPGVLDLAHQPDEWVGIDDMVAAAKVMALAALALLTRKG